MQTFLLAALIVALGCASPQRGRMGTDEVVPDYFQPRGEVVFSGPTRRSITAFDDTRVIGPGVSLSQNGDGSWSGWLQGRAVQLEGSNHRVDGASLSLRIEELESGGIEIRGHWAVGRTTESIYVRVTPEEFFARGASRTPSLFLKTNGNGNYGGNFYGDFAIELVGAARDAVPPEPQFAFAVLGALGG